MSCSCHGNFLRLPRPLGLSLQGRAQQRQVTVAVDPPQARRDEAARTGHPAVVLVCRAPVIDLVGQLAELGVERFQALGGLQADLQNRKAPQAMKRQRLLEAFLQTGDSRDMYQKTARRLVNLSSNLTCGYSPSIFISPFGGKVKRHALLIALLWFPHRNGLNGKLS